MVCIRYYRKDWVVFINKHVFWCIDVDFLLILFVFINNNYK